jgi:hypothetical protein
VLVTLVSVQSCGVTPAALALAATWPAGSRIPVVAELDPAGGDIAARFGLRSDTGLVTLAAALRRAGADVAADPLAACAPHLQDLAGGTRVLTAPISGAEAGTAFDVLADCLPLITDVVDVIADCGRLEPRPSPSVTRLLAMSTLTVVVVRPALSPLLRLVARLPEIRTMADPATVLLCGAPQYPLTQVEAELDIPVIGHLPHDPAAAAILRGEEGWWRRTHRLPLFRAAAAAAAAISERTSAEPACESRPAVEAAR